MLLVKSFMKRELSTRTSQPSIGQSLHCLTVHHCPLLPCSPPVTSATNHVEDAVGCVVVHERMHLDVAGCEHDGWFEEGDVLFISVAADHWRHDYSLPRRQPAQTLAYTNITEAGIRDPTCEKQNVPWHLYNICIILKLHWSESSTFLLKLVYVV